MPEAPEQPNEPDILDEGCARNVAVELHYDLPSGETTVCKSRMLEVTEDELYLDSVQDIGRTVELRGRQIVDAFFGLNDVRYSFKSQVKEMRTLYELNETKTLVGIILRRPKHVREGQRRTHFRVSLIADTPIQLNMHTAVADGSGTCPVDAHRFCGDLVNLSLGGAGIKVATEDGRRLKINDQVFMTFRLPGEPEVFYFLGEVRQVWSIADDLARRVGLKIKAWPNRRELQNMQRRLQAYLTELQRERLKRSA